MFQPPQDPLLAWASPLPLRLLQTAESESFKLLPAGATGLPVGKHPGAFAAVRKHHIHEGIDLYCVDGTPVTAVEDGEVVAVLPFTGPAAGLPWWLDTEVVLVEGASGVVAYGEIRPECHVGERLRQGQRLGVVTRVLRHDKGRPTSMLHLELHEPGSRSCPEWLGDRPPVLRDPTLALIAASARQGRVPR